MTAISSTTSATRASSTSAAKAATPAAAPKAKASSSSAASTFTPATKLGQKGLDLIKSFEGLRLKAYQDSVGVWTIGYGHTGGVKPGQTITKAQAEAFLKSDTGWAQDAVRKSVKVPLTQGQFDALTSFTFNLGAGALKSSTLLKKLNAKDYAGAQKEFGKWVHAGGQVLQGLVRRRAAEAAMFGNKAPSGSGTTKPPTKPPSTPTTGKVDYRVRAGDTMSGIAAKFKTTLSALKKLNPQIKNLNNISVGQLIHIKAGKKATAPAKPTAPTKPATPPKTTTKTVDYTVRPGDTMSGIAAKFKTTLSALKKLNPQIKNLNNISVGQKVHVKKTTTTATPPKPPSTPSTPSTGGSTAIPKGIPNTTGMSQAKKYELYSKYVAKNGDAQAKKDLAAGKRVIVGLRQNTDFGSGSAYRGTYDDRIVVMWKDAKGPHVAEFKSNTEPSRRWADDPSQASKPVGELVENKTFHYQRGFRSGFGDVQSGGNNVLVPDLSYGNPAVRRDTNRDHKLNSKDKIYTGDWGGQGYYFHRGGTTDTYSAGCQTMDQGRFNTFWDALGGQAKFSYVLAAV